jgi:hypothetical protein
MFEDISFHSTESSVVLSITSDYENRIDAEVHVHFGRYNIVKISIIVTSQTVTPKQGTEFLEEVMSYLEYQVLNSQFGLLKTNIELEVYVTIFYYGIRISYPPMIYGENEYHQLISNTKNKLDKMF